MSLYVWEVGPKDAPAVLFYMAWDSVTLLWLALQRSCLA